MAVMGTQQLSATAAASATVSTAHSAIAAADGRSLQHLQLGRTMSQQSLQFRSCADRASFVCERRTHASLAVPFQAECA